MKIKPFSNGSEYDYWMECNCFDCTKNCVYSPTTCEFGPVKCDIENAIAFASIDDGMIDKALADRAGLPESGRCKEFVPYSPK